MNAIWIESLRMDKGNGETNHGSRLYEDFKVNYLHHRLIAHFDFNKWSNKRRFKKTVEKGTMGKKRHALLWWKTTVAMLVQNGSIIYSEWIKICSETNSFCYYKTCRVWLLFTLWFIASLLFLRVAFNVEIINWQFDFFFF